MLGFLALDARGGTVDIDFTISMGVSKSFTADWVFTAKLGKDGRALLAESDADALPLTEEQKSAMAPVRVLIGRPKLATKKQLVLIRYSPEVIEAFSSSGSGWQARMDAVLKDYVVLAPLAM